MILITGATGTVGSETARQLAALGTTVRALARNPEKAKGMLGTGVEIAAGDLGDPASLEAALRGVERAFLLPPVDEHAVKLQENLIGAAQRAGTKLIVKLSALGAALDSPVPFLRQHAEGRKKLEASGIPFTELQPNSFMQNVLVAAPMISAEGVLYQPAADARISHIDARDIAAVAVKALTEAGHEGKIYPITGPEALSFEEVVAKLSAVLGKRVRYVNVSPADYKQGLLQYGVSEWQAEAVLTLYAWYREGKGALVTNVLAEVIGKAPITFDQFARDYAGAFRGARD
jgi:uncharacterized protein YbjT (DUF2867 family)